MTFKILVGLAIIAGIISCGRSPSRLLRVGQAPVYDFPLYLSTGDGTIYKFNADRTRETFVTGLNQPRGIAHDLYNNLYVVEQDSNRVVKINTGTKQITVVTEGLSVPSVIAIDSTGEAFVAQDGRQNIVRVSDKKVIAEFTSRPSALAFGVNDLMIIGLFEANLVQWGVGGPSTSIEEPVNVATDMTGRVYIAEGRAFNARVFRHHQKEPGTQTVIVDTLGGPTGLAVDPVGNMYVVERAAGRIVLATHDGELYSWYAGIIDPYYLAFTQY